VDRDKDFLGPNYGGRGGPPKPWLAVVILVVILALVLWRLLGG
jgi:hypothetical protein